MMLIIVTIVTIVAIATTYIAELREDNKLNKETIKSLEKTLALAKANKEYADKYVGLLNINKKTIKSLKKTLAMAKANKECADKYVGLLLIEKLNLKLLNETNNNNIDALKQRIYNLMDVIHETDLKVADLETTLLQTEEERDAMSDSVDALNERIDELEHQLAEVTIERDDLLELASSAEDDLSAEIKRSMALDDSLYKAMQKIAELEKQLRASRKTSKMYKEAAKAAKAKAAKAEAEKKELQKRLDEERATSAALNSYTRYFYAE